MNDAPDPPPDELRLRLRQQELATRFGLFALEQEGLQAVLDEVCRVAAEGLETRFAKVMRWQPDEGDFLTVAGVGWRPGVVGQARLGPGRLSPAGHVSETGSPVVTDDFATETRFGVPAVLTEHGIRSAINVPVRGRAVPYGALEVDSTARDNFCDADLAFLQALANTLSAAVERDARRAELAQVAAAQEKLLQDKDLLMQEVHHRVRNSLQLVHTLLLLQARSGGADARGALQAAAQRVMTIAAVHERLYRGGSVTEADAAEYLGGLVDDLRRSLVEPAGRGVELRAEPMRLSADQLTPLGLVAAELVTNALKYGRGHIRLAVRRGAGGIEVSAKDDGPGLPPGFDPARGQGLGMRLILTLAKGRDAIRVEPDGGVTVVMTL